MVQWHKGWGWGKLLKAWTMVNDSHASFGLETPKITTKASDPEYGAG